MRNGQSSSGWDQNDGSTRFNQLAWEYGSLNQILSAGDVIATAKNEQYRVTIVAEETMFIRNAEISNRIYLDVSKEMSEIINLQNEIKSLTKKNLDMQRQLSDLQNN